MFHRELLVQSNTYSWTLKRLYVKVSVERSAVFCCCFFTFTQTCHMTRVYYKWYWIVYILITCFFKRCFDKKNACNLSYIIVVERNVQYYLFRVKLFFLNNQSYILIILLIDWLSSLISRETKKLIISILSIYNMWKKGCVKKQSLNLRRVDLWT